MDERELERLVDRELKGLPTPHAPRTLLPRVMAAVAETPAQPWYSQPWVTWPVAAQAGSVVALAALLAAGWQLWMLAPQMFQQTTRTVTVMRTLWDVLLGPVAFFVIGLTVLVALACVAAWTAVSRATLGGASSQ